MLLYKVLCGERFTSLSLFSSFISNYIIIKKSITCSFNLLNFCKLVCFSFLFQLFSNVKTAKQSKNKKIKKRIEKKVERGTYWALSKN